MRYHYTPIRMIERKINDISNWRNRITHTLLVKIEMVQSPWKTLWQFLVKPNAQLVHNSKTAFLGIYS